MLVTTEAEAVDPGAPDLLESGNPAAMDHPHYHPI